MRSTAWAADKSVIVKSLAEFKALPLKKQRLADLANLDLIINQNILNVGGNVGSLQEKNRICNLRSVYGGHCVYSFSTSVQTQTSSILKESTRKGNVTFSFEFANATEEVYFCTIFGEHNGTFYRVSKYLSFF